MSLIQFSTVIFWLLFIGNCCTGLKNNKNYDSCCSLCVCSASYEKKRNDTIDCSDRNLTTVPDCTWTRIKVLYLQGNNISRIASSTMKKWRNLKYLDLSVNRLTSLPAINFTMRLSHLMLEHNGFTKVPRLTLLGMPRLEKIDLSFNKIKGLQRNTFVKQRRLEELNMHNNEMTFIEPDFMGKTGGTSLELLDFSSTNIESLPFGTIRKFKKLILLKLGNTGLKEIPNLALKDLKSLTYVDVLNADISKIGNSAFAFLPKLRSLQLGPLSLTQFPNLTGTDSLKQIHLHACDIAEIPDDLCKTKKQLETINLNHNRLTKIPDLKECSELIVIRLDHNEIQRIGDSVQGLAKLLDLTLNGNKLSVITDNDFKGLENLQTLYLEDNEIEMIQENAFSSFQHLNQILLSNTKFPRLPTKGLQTITHLSIKGNSRMLDFPSPHYFPRIEKIEVFYPYHCCNYLNKKRPKDDGIDGDQIQKIRITWLIGDNTSDPENELEFGSGIDISHQLETSDKVTCTPAPDPFFPCKDLMGDWVLRCGVWFVFLLALAGNATVIIVILASYTKMDVTRFLISNLAFADLFMGIYLGFLAIVDVTTFGNFQRYALDWQLSAGCQTAGFLAVLSSELSVFTLTVITLERYIAIKNAIRVNRKLDLKTAMVVMAVGWLFAIATASLPLVQISGYEKFSVCLPFEVGDTPSVIFLTIILCLNATAFLVILCCYILMYCSIRGSNAWNASDFRVAKRMALLVITDFLCWAPIVFLSLTAAFGSTLVSLDHAKIITVFVFPLNSCANPFLYAIFTSHFKKDMVAICRRVEDKYPFIKITKQKFSFSRRSSYSGAASENANIYLRMRRYSLPVLGRGFQNSVTSHDKNASSASSNSNNRNIEVDALVSNNRILERETTV